jgi:putative ABC transport system permease protein
MSTLNRKAWQDLSTRKFRSGLVIFSIALGVFGLMTIVSTGEFVAQQIKQSYYASRPADIILYLATNNKAQLASDSDLATVKNVAGVNEVEGRSLFTTKGQLPGQTRNFDFYLWAAPDPSHLRIEKFDLTDGQYPQAQTDEIALDRSVGDWATTSLGQSVTVLVNGQPHTFKIVGYITSVNTGSHTNQTVQGLVSLATMNSLTGRSGYDRIYATLNDPTQAVTIRGQAAQALGPSGLNITGQFARDTMTYPAQEMVDQVIKVMGGLTLIALVLSSFLVINIVGVVIAEQINQIGTMKAIGATAGMVFRVYLTLVFYYSLFGTILGLGLGLGGASWLSGFMLKRSGVSEAGLALSLRGLLFGLAVGLLVPALAAFVPVLTGTRITIKEALGGYGLQARFGKSRLDRMLEHVRFFNSSVSISLRNTFRRKGRATLTVIALALVVASFVAIQGAANSTEQYFTDLNSVFKADLRLNLNTAQPIDQLNAILKNVPGVAEVQADLVYYDDQTDWNYQVIAASNSLFDYGLLRSGRWYSAEETDSLLINEYLSQQEHLNLGDKLSLKLPSSQNHDYKIVGIVHDVRGKYVYLPPTALYPTGNWQASSFVVRTGPGQDEYALGDRLVSALSQVGLNSGYSSFADLRQSNLNQGRLLILILNSVVALIALVGGLSLFGTLAMNVSERRREIGVMRSIGATDGIVIQIFLVEGLFLGGLSWLLGLALSWPIAWLFNRLLSSLFGAFDFIYPFGQAALVLAGVLIVAAVSSIGPSISASRIKISQIIRY